MDLSDTRDDEDDANVKRAEELARSLEDASAEERRRDAYRLR